MKIDQRPQGSCPPSTHCCTVTLAPQPVVRGDVAHIIKPWCRSTRKRTVHEAISQVKKAPAAELFEMANSYFGLLGQAKSHHDRARLANAVRRRGHTVNFALTKTYRSSI